MCGERKGKGEREGGGVKNEERKRGRGSEKSRVKNEERETYFRELIHTVVEAGKSKVCRIDWQPGDPKKSCSKNPEVFCWQNFLFFQGSQRLC